MKVARLLAVPIGRLYLPEEKPLLLSKEYIINNIGKPTRDLPVAAHCLNQLHHCLPT
jgi:hypothetical protein